MDNSENYTYVRRHIVEGHIRRTGPKKQLSFTVPCPYSNGRGSDPGDELFNRDCPVCHGTGWISLPGEKEDYKTCGTCRGKGKDPEDMWELYPCHVCKGSGLVRI